MKKSILFVAMATMALTASAQWFDFSQNAHRYSIGFNLGQAGNSSQFHDFGFGASLSAWGVYVDFISAGPQYKYDNRVASINDPATVRFVPDSTTTVVNLGYQIPVLPWLRIMPIIGFNINSSGRTDLATHSAETTGTAESVSVELYHDYTREQSWNYLNYGGGIFVRPVKWIDIYGVYTIHAIYGGISFNLDAIFADRMLDD